MAYNPNQKKEKNLQLDNNTINKPQTLELDNNTVNEPQNLQLDNPKQDQIKQMTQAQDRLLKTQVNQESMQNQRKSTLSDPMDALNHDANQQAQYIASNAESNNRTMTTGTDPALSRQRKEIEQGIGDMSSAYLDTQQAGLKANRAQQMSDIEKQYADAVADGSMSQREAEHAYQQQVDQINQQAYDDAERTKLASENMGLQNSQQAMGMQASDNARKNSILSQTMTERDKRVLNIKDRLKAITQKKNSDMSNVMHQYDANMLGAQGQADQMHADQLNQFRNADYNTNRNQNFQRNMQDDQHQFQSNMQNTQNQFQMNQQQNQNQFTLQRDSNQQDYTQDNMGLQQQFDLSKMSKSQEHTLQNMARQQGYDLEKMDQNQVNQLLNMAVSQGYNVQNMAIQQGYQQDNMALQQGYTQDNMGLQHGFNRNLADQAYGHNRGLNEQSFGHNTQLADQAYGHNRGLNEQTFGHNTQLADQSFGHNTQLADQSYGHNKSLNKQQFGFNKELGEQQHGFNKDINEQQHGYNESLAKDRHGYNKELSEQEATQRNDINKKQFEREDSARDARLEAESEREMQEYDRAVERELAKFTKGTDEYDIREAQMKDAREQMVNETHSSTVYQHKAERALGEGRVPPKPDKPEKKWYMPKWYFNNRMDEYDENIEAYNRALSNRDSFIKNPTNNLPHN